jgi:hypothetical protein
MSKDTYTNYIADKKRDLAEEEIELLPEDKEERGWTVFRQDENGILFLDYQIRGFVKEAIKILGGKNFLQAYATKVDNWVYPDRRIYSKRDGKFITEPDGFLERPLRAMTAQGPRVTLARSDKLNPGATLEFNLEVLEPGEKVFTEAEIKKIFNIGKYSGLGQWRTGSYGRFSAEIEQAA